MAQKGSVADIILAQNLMPGVYNKFDASNAIRTPREMPRSILLVGQINNPLFNAEKFNKRITVTTLAEAKGLFGEGSMLYDMFVGAKKNAQLGLPINCIVLPDDPDAQAAEFTITVTADANHMTGEQSVYFGGERVKVGVSSEDQNSIAQKLYAKISKNAALPVVPVSLVDNKIVVRTKIKGAMGNQIDTRTRYYYDDIDILGVSITIARTQDGTVNPDLTDAITNSRNQRDTEWVVPYNDGANLAMLDEEVLRRWGHEVQTDFQYITVVRGTEAQHTTWLQGRNSPLGHSLHVTKDVTSPWVLAAIAGAAIESMASLNPCTPHTGVPLVGYKPAKQDEHFEPEQINLIMLDGGSGINVSEDGTATLLRMVTHYTTHSSGAYDTSMRELGWIKNLSWFRWYRNTEFQIKTQGFLMGEYAEPMPGQKIMTYEVAEDFLLGIYDGAIGIARMQNRDHYQRTMVLQIDGPRNLLKVQDEPVVMNGLYQTAITSQWSAGHV